MKFPTFVSQIGLIAVTALMVSGISAMAASDVFSLAPTTALAISETTKVSSTVGVTPTTLPPVSVRPNVIVHNASEPQRIRLGEALAKFADLDLDLPDLEVWFHGDESDCMDHYGLFSSALVPWRIDICGDLGFAYEHELAHAWEAANVDDATRRVFMTMRGLAVWNDSAVPWNERGIEEVAFIVQQGLLDLPVPEMSQEFRSRFDAFELLTGVPSPREVGWQL